MEIWNCINDNVNKENHAMDWNRDKVLAKEPVHKKYLLIGEEILNVHKTKSYREPQ